MSNSQSSQPPPDPLVTLYRYLADNPDVGRDPDGEIQDPDNPIGELISPPVLPARYRRKAAVQGIIRLSCVCAIALTVDKGGSIHDAVRELSDSLRHILPTYSNGMRQQLALRWIIRYV